MNVGIKSRKGKAGSPQKFIYQGQTGLSKTGKFLGFGAWLGFLCTCVAGSVFISDECL